MTHFEEQLKWRIDTADTSMLVQPAPPLAEKIWEKHQARKTNNVIALIACLSLLSFGYWLQLSLQSNQAPSFIAQGHQYERKLAQLSHIQLSDHHSAVMTNWHHELAVIDQIIDQSQGKANYTELWIQRTNLLKTMVEFYEKPIDVYEI
ncbi:hypothetical protein [Thalassotalea atypica]|uniref:hypothetical protein n=1 Tax=Thalassotalea atypica TaxID=2054316 RepID=UPI002574354A|nr:hypothetical protein [Thalassotalea atypica]